MLEKAPAANARPRPTAVTATAAASAFGSTEPLTSPASSAAGGERSDGRRGHGRRQGGHWRHAGGEGQRRRRARVDVRLERDGEHSAAVWKRREASQSTALRTSCAKPGGIGSPPKVRSGNGGRGAGADDALQAVLLGEFGFGLVVEHEAAALDGGDVFVGVKTKRHEIAKTADELVCPSRAEGLGCVLDDAQVVLLGDGVEAVAVNGQAGEIDGHDCPSRGRNGGFNTREVDVARQRIDVDEDRARADFEDDVAGCNP